jgi:hypothetical protein
MGWGSGIRKTYPGPGDKKGNGTRMQIRNTGFEHEQGHGTWIEKAVGKPADCPGPCVSLWILLNAGLTNCSTVSLICIRLQLDLFPTCT